MAILGCPQTDLVSHTLLFKWQADSNRRVLSPGRWHVSNVQKLLAVYMMQNFEAKLESTKNLNFEWRDALVPNQKNILLLKRRTK